MDAQSRPLNAATRDVYVPYRMTKLPVDKRGFLVPAFVHQTGPDEWDFRVIKPGWVAACHNTHRCWLCGEPLGKFECSVVGPMCAINRVSSEPPSHYECGFYAIRACPFLTKPAAQRNEKDLPEGREMAGIGIPRNPGVSMLWIAKRHGIMQTPTGPLFTLGDPDRVEFYAEGRIATHAEVLKSMQTGLPLLMRECKTVEEMEGLLSYIYRANVTLGFDILEGIPRLNFGTLKNPLDESGN